jgi:hypothetical protein
MAGDDDATWREFRDAVNMTASELEKWLDTEDARSSATPRRHLAQRPSGDVSESAWRYSLMNWGHDPSK